MAVLLLACAAPAASARVCQPVSFEEVRRDIGPSNGVGVARVVLRPGDVTLNNLLCLQERLKATHGDWVSVTVLAFSSKPAAINFEVDKIATAGVIGAFDRELRAVYWIGAAKDGDTLTLTPLGWELLQENDYNTVVVFPVKETPRCHIELNHRCVLALERIRYPFEALRQNASGIVTATGRIDKEGHPIDVKITATDVNGTQQRDLFVESALANLRTWRLEPALKDENFRVTVVYNLDASLRSAYAGATAGLRDRFRREGITRVEFGTDRITIRGALPE